MPSDLTTKVATKIYVTDKATVALRKDATTVFRAYLNGVETDLTGPVELNTTVYNNLP